MLKNIIVRKLFMIFIVSLVTCFSFGQTVVKGSITDQTGKPLIYAKVYFKKNHQFTTSDENGNFSFKIDNDYAYYDTLIIKYIGYRTLKINIHLNNSIVDLNNIIIERDNELLEIVDVVSPPPVNEILKKIRQNIPSNYTKSTNYFKAFYREVMTENNNCIELNEAIVKINYSSYSDYSKRFVKKGFKEYIKNGGTFKSLKVHGNIFRYAQYFPFYMAKDDEVYIIEGRKSNNLSKYGNVSTPYGGANDILAFDKVKFLYDFLDPKMKKKYVYTNNGKQLINGIICYEIAFKPNSKKNERVWHPIDEKMKQAIYTGVLYVSVNDFAVLSFKGQSYIHSDFSVYSKNRSLFIYPSELTFHVEYEKNSNNKYVLSKVKTEQTINKTIKSKIVRYTATRTIYLIPIKLNEYNLLDGEQYNYGRFVHIRSYIDGYNADFWKNLEKLDIYPALSKKIKADLDVNKTLMDQYLDQNKRINEFDLPKVPNLSTKGILNDTYYEYLKPLYDSLFFNYLLAENQYYYSVMEKLNSYKRRYTYNYFHLMKDNNKDVDSLKKFFEINNVKLVQTEDSLGNWNLHEYYSNKKVFNLSNISRNKVNFNFEEIKVNQSNYIAVSHSQKGEISYHLSAHKFGQDKAVFESYFVTDFYWLNDSSLIYCFTDSTHRPFQIRKTNIISNETSILYSEKNSNLELSLDKLDKDLILKTENKNESWLHTFNRVTNEFDMLVERKNKTNYQLVYTSNDSTFILSKGAENTILLKHSTLKKSKLDLVLYKTNSIIDQIVQTKDFLAFTEYKKGEFIFKYCRKSDYKIKELKSTIKNPLITILNTNYGNNEVNLSIESKVNVGFDLSFNMVKELIDTIETYKVSKPYDKSEYIYDYTEIDIDNGFSIPVTLIYKKKFKDSLKGMIVKTYGSYGSHNYPVFEKENLIYANAGLCIAYIYPRGTVEKGIDWYYDGKLLKKENTFNDYIACVEKLKTKFNLNSNQIIGYGTSAGGVVMGVSANIRPDLFGALIMDKPAISVLELLKNSKLCLATIEYSEWGNTNDSTFFNYIKSYSPYENIKEQNYPNILLLSKFHDMNTPYWFIAQSAIKYRQSAKNNPLILFNTDFEAGHRGNKNSLTEIDYKADIYAFIMYTINGK